MARGVLIWMRILATSLALLLGAFPAKADGPERDAAWVIEHLHPAGLARLVPLRGGPAVLIPVRTLPAGAREGDVLIDGALSPALRDKLLRAQRRLRDGARRGSFSLVEGGGGTRPLTAGRER